MKNEMMMHVEISGLGAMKEAKFDVKPLTVVCGSNNMGKTYATYALYGFLSFWRNAFPDDVEDKYVSALMTKRQTAIPFAECAKMAAHLLESASRAYSDPDMIAQVFGANSKMFKGAAFSVSVENFSVRPKTNDKFRSGMVDAHDGIVLKWEFSDKELKIFLYKSENYENRRFSYRWLVRRNLCACLKKALFDSVIPNPYIACAERTGAVIFQKELDFNRNRMMELLKEDKFKSMPPLFRLMDDYSVRYPLPIRNNVDVAREIPDGQESFLRSSQREECKKILELFCDIIGGEYKVVRGQAKFIPRGEQAKRLDMILSSSSVRALMHLGVYLHYQARPGDIFMMDEPEQNLHPENQRKMARLLALLSNVGVKVFITSHSDYIVREFNTLIMLNRQDPRIEDVKKRFGYGASERIDSDQIGVYCAVARKRAGQNQRHRGIVLDGKKVDHALGVEADFFDETISAMNEIQDELRMDEPYD